MRTQETCRPCQATLSNLLLNQYRSPAEWSLPGRTKEPGSTSQRPSERCQARQGPRCARPSRPEPAAPQRFARAPPAHAAHAGTSGPGSAPRPWPRAGAADNIRHTTRLPINYPSATRDRSGEAIQIDKNKSKAKQSKASQTKAMQNKAMESHANQSNANQHNTKQRIANQSQAKQRKTNQRKSKSTQHNHRKAKRCKSKDVLQIKSKRTKTRKQCKEN